MAELTVQTQPMGEDAVLCAIAGEMKAENFAAVAGACDAILGGDKTKVLVDMSELESLTSAGLGALVHLGRELAARSGLMVCAGATPGVLRTIDMLLVRDALSLRDTPDAGRKALAAGK